MCRRRPVRLRSSGRLSRFRTISRLRRSRTIRLRSGSGGCGLIPRAVGGRSRRGLICRTVHRRCGGRLSRPGGVGLIGRRTGMSSGCGCRFARRRNLYRWPRCRRGCGPQGRHLLLADGHAGMRCHCLLSRGERNGSWRRSSLRNYLPTHYRCRRGTHMTRGGGSRAEHCLRRRSDCHPCADRRRTNLLRIYRD